jgi:hypothetical protein
MKRLYLLFLLALAPLAHGLALVADIPDPGFPTNLVVDKCEFFKHPGTTTDATLKTVVNVIADGSLGSATYGNRICYIDLTGKTIVGVNNINLRSTSTSLGAASPFVPFTFTYPSSLTAPLAPRLVP